MYPASFMPVDTIWSAAPRTSLSVTLPAKKFQLCQPMGGVGAMICAAGLCDFVATGVAAGVWAEAVNDAKARTANEREPERRMINLCKRSQGILCRGSWVGQYEKRAFSRRGCRSSDSGLQFAGAIHRLRSPVGQGAPDLRCCRGWNPGLVRVRQRRNGWIRRARKADAHSGLPWCPVDAEERQPVKARGPSAFGCRRARRRF